MISSESARRIADEVLFPAAAGVDATGEIPAGHFDLLAEQGYYGVAAPPEFGGSGLDPRELGRIAEELAGGCLATTFTWMQHHGLVRGLVATQRTELREHYLSAAVRGTLRSGSALAGAIPQPPLLHATRVDGGYRLDGHAPFVSGWGLVDLVQVTARHGDEVVNGLVEARSADGLAGQPVDLIAVQGTRTARLDFDGFSLPDERVVGVLPHQEFLARQAISLRINGALALGVAGRCARLLDELGSPELAAVFAAERDAARTRLEDSGTGPDDVSDARAAASELAHRAAGALVTATGSTALKAGSHPPRLMREAAFTLVAAGRPQIKAGLLATFGGGRCGG